MRYTISPNNTSDIDWFEEELGTTELEDDVDECDEDDYNEEDNGFFA